MSVHDGRKWLPSVLDSIKKQIYPQDRIEVLTWNNDLPNENIGFWAGFEKLLPEARGKYVVALTDVILDSHFIENAIVIMEADEKIGALQAKIFQLIPVKNFHPEGSRDYNIIDTVGFQIFKSRRIINRGHGDIDRGQFEKQEEIFAVEGAAPLFRKEAFEDCRIQGYLQDPDFRVGPLGYGDDLDIAWRMHLLGWKQIYAPNVIAWHDRSTTKGISQSFPWGYLQRVKERQKIDIQKRRLDWSNVRFTIIKNDYIINILRDLPYIFVREVLILVYTILFEPKVLLELPRFFKLLPPILHKRKMVMQKAKINSETMRKFFT